MRKAQNDQTSFTINASEGINFFSTSWPVKMTVYWKSIDDKVILEISSESSWGSIIQATANSRKIDKFVESMNTYLE